jgi:hypothetical protein
MNTGFMKQVIIGISVLAAVAFLGISVVSTYNIFTLLIETESGVRGELWVLLVLTFTGGVIMLAIAWGIAELTESRRAERERPRFAGNMPDDEDE